MNKLIRRIEFYAFLVPIIAVAFVSISHVTSWYGISNPASWALYLSIGIEVAALSSLAGFSVGLGKYIYPPFILVTIIQFIGNIFYNFQYIDVDGELFKDWVTLVSPIIEVMGVDPNDIDSHKRILAFLEGGFLPPISLFFLHLLIKLSEKMKNDEMNNNIIANTKIDEPLIIKEEPKIVESKPKIVESKDVVEESPMAIEDESDAATEVLNLNETAEFGDVMGNDITEEPKKTLTYRKRNDR